MSDVIKNGTPLVMGILNVTPDSFSDGGLFQNPDAALKQAALMVKEGADIIDVGGESSRPGSVTISAEEEAERVVPVIEQIAKRFDITVSVDTVKPLVAEEAIAAGASMLNDVSMLRDPLIAGVAAQTDVQFVIMHSRGNPGNMQQMTKYDNGVVSDVLGELLGAVEQAVEQGVKKQNIWLDPGIGFAKTAMQNIEILSSIEKFAETGFPVLTGPSKKSFIGVLTGADVDHRLGGTAAAVTASILGGAKAVRVHDVAIIKQVVQIADALFSAGRGKKYYG